MKTLEGKIALVTGATSGIGRATAIAMGQAGAKVVVTGRREAEGAETVKLVNETGAESFFVRTDVSKEEDSKRAVDETVARYGRLDIAVNNAGVEDLSQVPNITHDLYEHVFGINVWGMIASMKYEIPAMLANGGGSIINVSSVAGRYGFSGAALYCASKGAVEQLTKTAALDYATQGIRINAVAPAVIVTPMADRFADTIGANYDALATMHPMGRVGRPEEVAETILFLASDAASFITGSSLGVDGGLMAK